MVCEDWDSAFSHGHWGCLGPSHKRFSLCRGTPPYFPWHSYGCSHHQCLFPFRVTLRFPPLCSLWQWALQANEAPWTSAGRKHLSGFLPHHFLGRSLSLNWSEKGARLNILVIFHHSPKSSLALFRGLFIPTSSQVSDHQQLLLSHCSFHPDATLRMQELSLLHEVAQHFSQGLWIRWPHVLSVNPGHFVKLLAPMSALGPLN